MEPRKYLNKLRKDWNLIVDLFESNRTGGFYQQTLIDYIEFHYKEVSDPQEKIEQLLKSGIIEQPVSSETSYQLGRATENIVRDLLEDHRLGLSESIKVHIEHLDKLSALLQDAVSKHEEHDIVKTTKNINHLIQDIKHQVSNNLNAVQRIVLEAKNSEINKRLKDRYSEVIDAWEQYIHPMGEMIDIHGSFDSLIDKSIRRIDQSRNVLRQHDSMTNESNKVHQLRKMLSDMRFDIVKSYQSAREILKPLYEVARRNSRVTRGASIMLELVKRNRLHKFDEIISLNISSRTRSSLISKNGLLTKYLHVLKDFEEVKPPKIILKESRKENGKLPIDLLDRMALIQKNIPIGDFLMWLTINCKDDSLTDIFNTVQKVYDSPSLALKVKGRKKYEMQTHFITGPILDIENMNERN